MSQFSVGSIYDLMQAQQDKANAANLQRYNQGLSTLSSGYGQAQSYLQQGAGSLATIGDTARTQAKQNVANQAAQAQQGLVSRGLGNSTITSAVGRGYDTQLQNQMNSIDESQAGQQRAYLGQQSNLAAQGANQTANFIAARNDVGPNAQFYSELMRSANQQNQGKINGGTRTVGDVNYNSMAPKNSGGGGGGGSSGMVGGMGSSNPGGGGASGYQGKSGGGGNTGGTNSAGGISPGQGGGWDASQSPSISSTMMGGAGGQFSSANGLDRNAIANAATNSAPEAAAGGSGESAGFASGLNNQEEIKRINSLMAEGGWDAGGLAALKQQLKAAGG